jgi:hypothetical protein
MGKDKNSVLDEDDFIDLPEGVLPLDVEAEVDDDAGLPFQLFDDDPVEDDPKAKANGKGDDEQDDDEEEDEPLAADAERATLVAQLTELQSKLAEQEETSFKSSAEGRKHIATMADITLESLNSKEEALADKLKRARDDGEAGEEIALKRQIEQIDHIRKSIQTVKANAEKEPEKPQKTDTGGGSDTGGVKARGQLAARWQAHNAAWMNDPAKRGHLAFLKELDKEMAASGRNPQTEDYYKEMTRRMNKEFPSLGVRHIDGKPPASGQRQRGGGKGSPVAGAKPSNGSAPNQSNKVQLTAEDLRMMRTLKLDTSNKDTLKEFAKNKSNKSPYMR